MSNTVLMPIEPASLKSGAALRIIPEGQFRTWDGRPKNIPGWKMDATIAARVIAASQTKVDAYVIDYEHQTLNKEKNGQPSPAAGWFKGLEYLVGLGLFMTNIEWTDKARTMIAAGEYRYLSPVFAFDPVSGEVTSIYSVALTNSPALEGLADLSAATAKASMGASPPAISDEDRYKLNSAFGHLPGFDMDAVVTATARATADVSQAAISAEDRAKVIHMFGHLAGFELPR